MQWKAITKVYSLVTLAIFWALPPTLTHADVVTQLCTHSQDSYSNLVTVDYSAQTLGVDNVDAAGSVTIMAYHRMRASFTDETIMATWTNGPHYVRYTLNRYSGVLRIESYFGAGYGNFYTNPCVPYVRGPKKV
jgi:hypothetical protein